MNDDRAISAGVAFVVFVAIALAFLCFVVGQALARDLPPPLSLAKARAVVAATGVNVGKVFLDGEGNRYLIRRVNAKAKHPGTFQVEVQTVPLPRMEH